MLSLSPAKLLVILVVALIVLGPDKLPQMARQLGAFWHDIRQWRGRIESEVRGTFPNLPPTHEVARVVRSPLSFLERLADEHEATLESDEEDGSSPAGAADRAAAGDEAPDGPVVTGGASTNGSGPGAAANGATTRPYTGEIDHGTGWRATDGDSVPAEATGVAPDDPSMN